MFFRIAVALLAIVLSPAAAWCGEDFQHQFEDATLRIDFHHTGNAATEFIAIDRLYRQGI